MSRRGIMSEGLKDEIARQMGVYGTVHSGGGWGEVSSRDCGNMVRMAIELAQKNYK